MIRSVVSLVVFGGFIVALGGLYLLPVLIGWSRRIPDIAAVVMINILLGWTLIGWVVALALALRPPRPGGSMVQVTQYNTPPAPPPDPVLPPSGKGSAGPLGPPARRDAPPPLTLPPRQAGPGSPPQWSSGYGPPGGFASGHLG
jgi:hypothetical protein